MAPSQVVFSMLVVAVSALALWHRSLVGWVVAALANLLALWLLWPSVIGGS